MGDYTLHLGDCLEFMASLADGSVDAVITDPPYNAINRESSGLRSFDKGTADSLPVDIPVVAAEFMRIARGSIYVWCSDEQYTEWTMAFKDAGLTTRKCAWWKTNPSPMNGERLWLSALELCVFARKPNAPFYLHCAHPVWRGPTAPAEAHPTPKPLWLMRQQIEASVPVGGSVIDPFTGSGTTGAACIETNRRFIGCEISPEYHTIAQERIEAAYRKRHGLAIAAKSTVDSGLFALSAD